MNTIRELLITAVKTIMMLWLVAVIAIILYIIVSVGSFMYRSMVYHDYMCPLPNGYSLVRLNAYDVQINKGLSETTIKPLIYKIEILPTPEVIIGERGNVSEDSELDKEVEYFSLDTVSDELTTFSTELELKEFVAKKYQVQDISMRPPRKLYNEYRKGDASYKNISLTGSVYGLLSYGKDNSYIQGLGFDSDEDLLKVNPTKIAIKDDFVIGFSENKKCFYRGNQIIEGYFVFPPFEFISDSDYAGEPASMGLTEDEYIDLLKKYKLETPHLQNLKDFINDHSCQKDN